MTWKRFILLRKWGLQFSVPFYFVQDNYRNGRILLTVWRFGMVRSEVWQFFDDFDIDWLDQLRLKGASKSEQYSRIKFSAKCLIRTKHFREAKNLC
jgi:hypothetical protein